MAIGQSKSCFPKIDLSNEHDGGTNLSERLLFITPNEQILLMMFVILRRTVKKKDFELLWWLDACGQMIFGKYQGMWGKVKSSLKYHGKNERN